MDMMGFERNQIVRVRDDAPHHAGRTGYFAFMGGPNGNVAVISVDPYSDEGAAHLFATSPKYLEPAEDPCLVPGTLKPAIEAFLAQVYRSNDHEARTVLYEIVNDAYGMGYGDGEAEGRSNGYYDGRTDGYEEGRDNGYSDGYDAGRAED